MPMAVKHAGVKKSISGFKSMTKKAPTKKAPTKKAPTPRQWRADPTWITGPEDQFVVSGGHPHSTYRQGDSLAVTYTAPDGSIVRRIASFLFMGDEGELYLETGTGRAIFVWEEDVIRHSSSGATTSTVIIDPARCRERAWEFWHLRRDPRCPHLFGTTRTWMSFKVKGERIFAPAILLSVPLSGAGDILSRFARVDVTRALNLKARRALEPYVQEVKSRKVINQVGELCRAYGMVRRRSDGTPDVTVWKLNRD